MILSSLLVVILLSIVSIISCGNPGIQVPHANLVKHEILYRNYYALNNTDDLQALKEFSVELNNLPNAPKDFCSLKEVGSSWGAHFMCTYDLNFTAYEPHCNFISCGISYDFSFDKELDEKYLCRGFALDPTVQHPIRLTPRVIFLNAGANSPSKDPNWSIFSIPELRKSMGKDLFILKMDCEGCEYSLAGDIINHDINFFQHVQQFNIEIHSPMGFMATENEVYGFGRLYRLLKLANMHLVHADNGRCSPTDERKGCHPYLVESGFPCLPGCRSFLFAKKHVHHVHTHGHFIPKSN
jgi:hypothetical protein